MHLGSGNAKAAGKHFVGHLLANRFGSASEQRLIDFDASPGDEPAVNHDLVTGTHDKHITDCQFRRIDRLVSAIPAYRQPWPRQHRDLVQRALGANFLHNRDQNIEQNQADCHQCIAVQPVDEQNDADRLEHGVDQGENVALQSFPV